MDDIRTDAEGYILAIRKIAANVNERTSINTILPPKTYTCDSINYIVPWRLDAQQATRQLDAIRNCYTSSLPAPILAYLSGVLNSFVLDFVLRFKVSGNVNIFYIYQLPVPRLKHGDTHCRVIAERVAKLVCVGAEFDGLRRELLSSVEAHVATNPIERQHLQNEIDALVAHLYGLEEEDLRHILYASYTFPLVSLEIKDGVMAAFARVEEMLEEG
jgi:hypothetical protein